MMDSLACDSICALRLVYQSKGLEAFEMGSENWTEPNEHQVLLTALVHTDFSIPFHPGTESVCLRWLKESLQRSVSSSSSSSSRTATHTQHQQQQQQYTSDNTNSGDADDINVVALVAAGTVLQCVAAAGNESEQGFGHHVPHEDILVMATQYGLSSHKSHRNNNNNDHANNNDAPATVATSHYAEWLRAKAPSISGGGDFTAT